MYIFSCRRPSELWYLLKRNPPCLFLIGIVQPQSVLEVSTQYLDILLEENATVTLYLRLGKICYALTTVFNI